MRLSVPKKRQPTESVIPMINVVFLLLIFFLMSAKLTAPSPVEVTPPTSVADTPVEGADPLFVDAMGVAAYRDLTGQGAVTAFLTVHCAPSCPPAASMRADRTAPAPKVAALVSELARAGITKVELVTVR